jgi:hypothetical protein
MPIIRTYECQVCAIVFEAWHQSGDEPEADCPVCEKIAQWRPQSVNIGTAKGRAIDYTQTVLEQDYGITNFRDGQREGDVAHLPEPETTEQRNIQAQMNDHVREALNKDPVAAAMAVNDPTTAAALKNPNLAPAMKGFWGNTGGVGMNTAAVLAGAKSGPAAHSGLDLLHRTVKVVGEERADIVKNTPPLSVYRGPQPR